MSNLNQLINFYKIPGYKNLLEELRLEGSHQIPVSLPRSVRLPLMAALQQDLNVPILFITSRPDRLQSMHDEYEFWSGSRDHLIFAEPAPLFYERANWDPDTRKDRIQTLISLAKSYWEILIPVSSNPESETPSS